MARKKTSKMVVEKSDQGKAFGFETDQFSFETNKTLLKNKIMTFSATVARQIGYTKGEMKLTLVWEGKRMDCRFVRDSHPGGGWRSVKEDFLKFFEEVKFKENQGYCVYQVPGLGQYAFEVEKSWEYFPHGGTVKIPTRRHRLQIENPEAPRGEAEDAGQSSKMLDEEDVLVWRRPVTAKKTDGASVGQVKKRKPRMRTGGPGKLKRQKDESKSASNERQKRSEQAKEAGKRDDKEDQQGLKLKEKQELTRI